MTVSIGFMRDDGDFQLVATLNNTDELFETEVFDAMAHDLREAIQRALPDEHRHELVEILRRQDAPDYVSLE